MSTEDYYNKRENYKMGGMRKSLILSLIPDNVGMALDIGCANGELAEVLQEKGWKVTGTDVSKVAVEESKKFLTDGHCFDIEKEWPKELLDKKFDLVVASEILEHIFEPITFLKKVRPLVAPGGKVVITTSNVLFWKNRFKMLFGKFEYEKAGLMDYGHVRFFTAHTIKSALREGGFNIVKERNFYPNLYKRGLNFLGNVFPGLLAYNMVFLLEPISDAK